LADAELVLDGDDDLAGSSVLAGQEIEDPASNRITEDVECVHP
jgi:hypothetical protein